MLDAESGKPITSETLRYRFRVVGGVPCAEAWRGEAWLALVGGAARLRL